MKFRLHFRIIQAAFVLYVFAVRLMGCPLRQCLYRTLAKGFLWEREDLEVRIGLEMMRMLRNGYNHPRIRIRIRIRIQMLQKVPHQ